MPFLLHKQAIIGAPIPEMSVAFIAEKVEGWENKSLYGSKENSVAPITGKYPKEVWPKILSKDLHKWTAVQAVGIVDDHIVPCFRHGDIK